jgi:hypothetical protein
MGISPIETILGGQAEARAPFTPTESDFPELDCSQAWGIKKVRT